MTTDLLSEKFIKGLESYGLSYDDIKNSWKYCGGDTGRHNNYFHVCFPTMSSSDIEHEEYCICGHYIQENCYITNSTETEILVLGNCCIKKFIPKSTRTCEICKSPHKNRIDNKCSVCRKFGSRDIITTKYNNEIKKPLKELTTIIKTMKHSNINPLDKTGLSLEDKHKLTDYDIIDFSSLILGDHFRYTQNKYKEAGRKVAYGVVHGIDNNNQILEVNCYKSNDEEDYKYPNWKIDLKNKYKNYILYNKIEKA